MVQSVILVPAARTSEAKVTRLGGTYTYTYLQYIRRSWSHCRVFSFVIGFLSFSDPTITLVSNEVSFHAPWPARKGGGGNGPIPPSLDPPLQCKQNYNRGKVTVDYLQNARAIH